MQDTALVLRSWVARQGVELAAGWGLGLNTRQKSEAQEEGPEMHGKATGQEQEQGGEWAAHISRTTPRQESGAVQVLMKKWQLGRAHSAGAYSCSDGLGKGACSRC